MAEELPDKKDPNVYEFVGVDMRARKPGATCFRAAWDNKQNRLTIDFDPSWWHERREIQVLIDGQNIQMRKADVLQFTRFMQQIADRKDGRMPVFDLSHKLPE